MRRIPRSFVPLLAFAVLACPIDARPLEAQAVAAARGGTQAGGSPAVGLPTVTLDSAFLAGYRWRNLGPDRGGRSIAASGVVGRPLEGYFGATGGGLWKTTDGGENWWPVTDFKITSASVGAAT